MAGKMQKTAPESLPHYHDTWKLLKNYRDVSWNLEIANLDLQAEFRSEYGVAMEGCLESLAAAGADLQGTRIESFARSLERSRKMLGLLDAAILLMRKHHKKGELYYWTLYYTFLSPQEYANYREILTALEAHFPPMSRRTYYIRREEAVQTLSSVLWGYTSKECLAVLEQLEL